MATEHSDYGKEDQEFLSTMLTTPSMLNQSLNKTLLNHKSKLNIN